MKMHKKLISISIKDFNRIMNCCFTIEGEEDVWHMKRTIDGSILRGLRSETKLYADITGWMNNLRDEL